MKVRVLAYHEDEVWLKSLLGGTSFTVGNPAGFRPIRTESERKRKEAIDAIAELCRSSSSNGHSAELVYSAIEAGNIPGVKLEVTP